MLERHARMNLCQDLLIFLIDNDHGQLLVFYEITSFIVEDFQCDATIATFFRFFLECKLYIDAFTNDMRNRRRWTKLSIFEYASSEVKKAIKELLVV